MSESKSGQQKPQRPQAVPGQPQDTPWSVPVAVADVPQIGRHFDLAADAATFEAVAKLAGVARLSGLAASFDLVPVAQGVRVSGTVSADVEQNCVVTLDPVTSRIEEPVDVVFALPAGVIAPDIAMTEPDPPDTLHDGVIDLGAVATEFLILGIDPYPRKPGVQFEPPHPGRDPADHPFAALSALKKGSGPKPG